MEVLCVPIADITIPPERIRRAFDTGKLNELAESIVRLGLMHPVVVRRLPTGQGTELVAGERRLRCIAQIYAKGLSFHCAGALVPTGTVPTLQLQTLSAQEVLEAELQENTVRQDISWQERSVAIAKLHHLRASQRAIGGEVQTLKATTEEVVGDDPSGYAQQQIRNAIILASHLHDPDVAKAGSQKEAIKIVERKTKELFAQELSSRIDITQLQSKHRLILGSCIYLDEETLVEDPAQSQLRKFPDKTFDVIMTDPPYGVSADDWVALSGSEAATKHRYRDDFDYVKALMTTFLPEAFRVSKPAAHMYMCCDIRLWPVWAKMAAEVGWAVWPVPLIWSKKGQGMIIGNVDGPRRTYEAILYARCGGKGVQKVGSDVVEVASVQAELHAAQKPVELYEILLSWSCVAGDSVLDAFAGSGTIFPAANRLKLYATAIEKRPENVIIAGNRINDTEEKDNSLSTF